jgi:hypothetical protein
MSPRKLRSPIVDAEIEDIDEMLELAEIMRKEKEFIESLREAISEEMKSWGIVEDEFKVDIEEHGDIWWTLIPSKEKKGG